MILRYVQYITSGAGSKSQPGTQKNRFGIECTSNILTSRTARKSNGLWIRRVQFPICLVDLLNLARKGYCV